MKIGKTVFLVPHPTNQSESGYFRAEVLRITVKEIVINDGGTFVTYNGVPYGNEEVFDNIDDALSLIKKMLTNGWKKDEEVK